MIEGDQKAAWDHTAAICATVINMHRDPKKGKPISPTALNPYRNKGKETPKIKLNKEQSMKLLKRVFIDKKPVDMGTLCATGKVV